MAMTNYILSVDIGLTSYMLPTLSETLHSDRIYLKMLIKIKKSPNFTISVICRFQAACLFYLPCIVQ